MLGSDEVDGTALQSVTWMTVTSLKNAALM